VPFILGPLNGGVPWPQSFDTERRREREWLSYIRGIYKLNWQQRRTLQSSAAIVAGSKHTADEFPAYVQDRVIWLPENAIDPNRFNLVAKQDISGTIKACFIGRLVPYKGPDMLLTAAADLLRDGRLKLDIIGDGPMRDELKAQAEQLGVSQKVRFLGNLPHEQVQTVAAEANLLTFPSIREFGGGVVLEAMALGVVPIVVDYAGPGELVTDQVGFKIPIGTRSEIVESLSTLLKNVINDPLCLQSMSTAGRERVRSDFTWTAKAHQIAKIYDWVMNGGDRPSVL
jgi:glycosyltransferase involved in cell wall biosynthesis